MEKRTYYINVGTGEVLEDPEALNFEFEISATDEQIDKLQELFEEVDNAAQSSSYRAVIPWREYHFDEPNDTYDYYAKEIYRMLHELGNEQTRKHIESMKILQ